MTKICCIQIVFSTSFYYGCIVAAVIEVDFCACHSTFYFFGTTGSNLHCLLAYCLICMIFKGTTLEDTTVHSSAAATESITKKPVSRSYLMPPPAYPPSKPSSGITKTSIAPSSSEVPVLYRLSPSPMKSSSGDLKGGESIKASTASKAQLSASNKVPIKASSAISKGSGSIATKSSQKKQIDQEDEDDDSSTIVIVQQDVELDHAEDSAAAAALMKLGGRGTTSGTPTSTTRMKMLEERNSRRGVARKNYRE